MSPGRRRGFRLLLPLLALAAAVGTDVAFTHVYLWASDRFARPQPKHRVKSPVYHHGLAPLISQDHERWGPVAYPYRTNSLGFRDASCRQVEPRSPRRRLLFMGDSFTEGVGVAWPESFVGRIDAALSPGGTEVLNAGVELYSPLIYYRKTQSLLEDTGLRFDEVLLFLDISDIQDEVTYAVDGQGRVVFDERRRRLEERANWAYSAGFPRLRRLERLLDEHTLLLGRLYHLVERPLGNPRHRGAAWTFDDRVFEEYGREGLARAREHMDALVGLLRPRGICLTVAVYPWPDQVLERDRNSRQVRFWREWAQQNGAGFIDLFPEFVGSEDPALVVERDFIPGDVHWNASGHRRVAEAVLRELAVRPRPCPGS